MNFIFILLKGSTFSDLTFTPTYRFEHNAQLVFFNELNNFDDNLLDIAYEVFKKSFTQIIN